jgi:hypothetical protein
MPEEAQRPDAERPDGQVLQQERLEHGAQQIV